MEAVIPDTQIIKKETFRLMDNLMRLKTLIIRKLVVQHRFLIIENLLLKVNKLLMKHLVLVVIKKKVHRTLTILSEAELLVMVLE